MRARTPLLLALSLPTGGGSDQADALVFACGGRRGSRVNASEACDSGRPIIMPDAADAAPWGAAGFAGLFNGRPLAAPSALGVAAPTEEAAEGAGDGGSELDALCCAAMRSEAVSSRMSISAKSSAFRLARSSSGVTICTFVPVKQVN